MFEVQIASPTKHREHQAPTRSRAHLGEFTQRHFYDVVLLEMEMSINKPLKMANKQRARGRLCTHKSLSCSRTVPHTLTLTMATKGITFFMYFFSSGKVFSSLAITLLSGS